MDIASRLAEELNIDKARIKNTIALIDEGNTIPFIARYRKEVTGGLDDESLRELFDRLTYIRNLETRREEVIRLIDEQDKLDQELLGKIKAANTLTELDDIYRPYRPKRRTRATIAKAKGLSPLADILLAQDLLEGNISRLAEKYIDEEKEVNTAEEALQGAMDIIAEIISDNGEIRGAIRKYTHENGSIAIVGKDEEESVYEMYYDYEGTIKNMVPHRILAINRGEKEGFLSVKVEVDEVDIERIIMDRVITRKESISYPYLELTIKDAYKRLIAPSIEREIRSFLTQAAEEQAIKVFGENLDNLLLQPPIKGKVVMGVDPGYRTGNKIAVVDDTGRVLDTGVIYMTLPNHDLDKAKTYLEGLIRKHNVDIVAIGNGTASRETELVVAELLKGLDIKVYYIVVSEAGASVYSASPLASEEFPDFDVALRSAISIARRLQDPLAELVKIEPKAIGVGQYQHDVNQKSLADTLEGVVESCVNRVGVDLNTASPALLQYVAGITKTVSKNIAKHREGIGKFSSRRELLKVAKLGPKTFEQCAGFLRIPGGENILDNTGVHPESYKATEELLKIGGYSLDGLEEDGIKDIQREAKRWDIAKLSQVLELGIPTLNDIIEELKKPGRDPREELPKPILRSDVLDIKDLKPGMIMMGTVRNVVDFGAFVDLGVHHDGLVHISQLSNRYVKHPMDVVQVGDIVQVKVLDVDLRRNRIGLTMKGID